MVCYLKLMMPSGYGYDPVTYWKFDFYRGGESEVDAAYGIYNLFNEATPDGVDYEILKTLDEKEHNVEESFKSLRKISDYCHNSWNCGKTAMDLFWNGYD